MHVTLLAIGRLRDPAVRSLCAEYLKRVSRHLRVDIVEVRSDEEALRRIEPAHRVVALEASGTTYTSEALARWLDHQLSYERAPLVFLIGGAEGLGPALRQRSQETLSLGPLTLPHRLARVVLVEQLYRAMSILRGEPYHK